MTDPTPGPRGAAHEPSVDPWKGLRGIMAGTLVLEAIVIGLVLTVIARLDGGAHFQPWKVWLPKRHRELGRKRRRLLQKELKKTSHYPRRPFDQLPVPLSRKAKPKIQARQ